MRIISLAAITTLAILVLALSSTGAIASSTSESEDWKTSYTVGKFSHSVPAKADQIFKVYHRVINGTIDNFSTAPLQIVANVSSADTSGGVLEIKYPRNYPYHNDPKSMSAGVNNFIIFAQKPSEGEVQIAGDGTTTDCFFVLSIPFTGKIGIGIYSSYIPEEDFAFYGDNVPASCLPDTVVSNVPTRNDGTITPWQQFKAGVAAEDVVCRNGFELIIQPASGKPYCATHDTKLKLIQWWNIQIPTG